MTDPLNPQSIPAVLARRDQAEQRDTIRAALAGITLEVRNGAACVTQRQGRP